MHRIECLLLVSLLASLPLGCGGSDGPPHADRVEVSGTVSLDGRPLESGAIEFDSAEDRAGGEALAGGRIVNGVYNVQATSGTKTVRISVREEYGEPDSTGAKMTRETIPAKYNTESVLEAKMTADPAQSLHFDLESGTDKGIE